MKKSSGTFRLLKDKDSATGDRINKVLAHEPSSLVGDFEGTGIVTQRPFELRQTQGGAGSMQQSSW